jgi:elongation factor 1-beta
MTSKCSNVKNDKLVEFNALFANKSYVNGCQYSQADVDAAKDVLGFDAREYPHLSRWLSHILAKSKCENVCAKGKTAEDDDIDLFGSEEEESDEETKQAKAKRLADYSAKKASKGPGPAAKSSIIFDVKPWDDTTDLAVMEKQVRDIQMDGLLWGASQVVPIGYGINKLQISCVIEDDKVGVDSIEEAVTALEDFVQSIDIVSFNKI